MAKEPKVLSQKEVEKELKDFPDWFLDPERGKMVTAIEFKDFAQAVSFINSLGKIAEEMNHHPDIFLYDYKYIQLLISTKDVDGFTEQDFDLMEEIDELLEHGDPEHQHDHDHDDESE